MRKWLREQQPDLSTVVEIPLTAIDASPYQARRVFATEALHELAASIRRHGLLQPITVRALSNHRYQLIAGERRMRACRLAGLDAIRALIVDVDESEAALLCMMENLQREGLHFFEEAEGYASLIHVHGLTQEQVADRLGKQQSTIANKLRLLRLPPTVRDMLVRNDLTERHARALLRLPDEQRQLDILRRIIENNLNVRQTDDLVAAQVGRILTPAPSGHINRIYGDWRLLNNSIKVVVNQMRTAGIPVGYTFMEMDDHVEMRVTVPKNARTTNVRNHPNQENDRLPTVM